MTQRPDEAEQVSAALRKVLNMHGHGFHYAILRRTEQLFTNRESGWVFDGAEFPVVARRETTHIDFILRSRSGRTYLVAECKRVDPARGRWCFARAPYTWRNSSQSEVVFDQFRCRPANILGQEPCIRQTHRGGPYHIGLEIKTGGVGDSTSHSGSAINQAVTQVLRGVSGLINHLFEFNRRSYQDERIIRFVPAIFTTAQLWATETDLGAADLASGDLSLEVVQAKEVDWIWFSHNRSPGLRHDLEWNSLQDNISKELEYEFARSIAVISPKGLDNFLTMQLEEWLE